MPDAAQSGKAQFCCGPCSLKDKAETGQSVLTAQSIWLGLEHGYSCETRLRDKTRQVPSTVLVKKKECVSPASLDGKNVLTLRKFGGKEVL